MMTAITSLPQQKKRDLPAFSSTSSDTLVTWSNPEEGAITTQGNTGRNGIIRWYDPITGRWLSNDPIGISGGLNQYVFCGGNPVMFRDPWGLAAEEADGWDGTSITITQGEFDKAMANAYADVMNFLHPMGFVESIPFVGELARLGRLDIEEFREFDRTNKTKFNLQKGDGNKGEEPTYLGLGEEINYAKIGMWDYHFNPVPGSSMYAWKRVRYGEHPSAKTKQWYKYGRDYAKKHDEAWKAAIKNASK